MNRPLKLLLAAVLSLTACAAPAVSPRAQPQPSPSPVTSAPTTGPTTGPTTEPTPSPAQAHPRVLRPGGRGADVLSLQRRLTALGYWLGPPDGVFGDTTEQAVYALQKAAGITRDGLVGPNTRDALARGVVPRPRSTVGRVVEIDLARDLLLVVTNGSVGDVLNVSTGGGYTYIDRGVLSVARTPTGHFRIFWQYDGLRVSPLGELWRPKYFVGGYAIHGYPDVPPYPASHGCVRVSDVAIDWIWRTNQMPLGTAVWIY